MRLALEKLRLVASGFTGPGVRLNRRINDCLDAYVSKSVEGLVLGGTVLRLAGLSEVGVWNSNSSLMLVYSRHLS